MLPPRYEVRFAFDLRVTPPRGGAFEAAVPAPGRPSAYSSLGRTATLGIKDTRRSLPSYHQMASVSVPDRAIPVVHLVDLSDGNDLLFGKANMILSLMREQRRSGTVMPRLAVFSPCTCAQAAVADGFGVDVLEDRPRTLPTRSLPALIRVLRAAGGSIVHTHGYKPNILARAARAMGAPMSGLVSTCHGFIDASLNLRLYNVVDRITGFASDFVAAPDVRMLRAFPSYVRTEFIPNALADLSPPDFARRAASRAKFGWPDDAYVIGKLGRFVPEKGVANFAGAAKMSTIPGAIWAAAGAGELETLLKDPSTPSLRCVGYVDPGQYLDGLDVYVQPSFTEGLALALLEAMRAALPIVATRVGATESAVRHEREGLLVEPDPKAIADAVARLHAEPDLARRLGMAARARFEEQFRISAQHGRYYEIYTRLIRAA